MNDRAEEGRPVGGRGASRPTLPLWKRLLFSGVLLLLVLAVFEGVAQIYMRAARGYAGGNFLQYEFDPYKNIRLSRNWTDTRGVHHNAQGFRRSTDVAREKPPGTFRIFLMGASTAYGTGGLWPHIQRDYEVLDNSETIDAYLEEILDRSLDFERVEVINAAIPSVWTHHHLVYLNQTILNYDPDLVLFLDGLNDHFYYNRDHDQFADYAYQEASYVIMGPPTLYALARMNAWWLFRKSALAHLLFRGAQTVATAMRQSEPPPIDVEHALTDLEWVFEHNALQMIERNALILRNEGVRALFMLQPMLVLERERLDRMPEVERRLFEFNVEAREENYEEFTRRATPLVARMIEERVTPLGASFLDLTTLFRDAEGQMFTDYAHLTPEANRLLAQRVAEEIVSMLDSTSAAP